MGGRGDWGEVSGGTKKLKSCGGDLPLDTKSPSVARVSGDAHKGTGVRDGEWLMGDNNG